MKSILRSLLFDIAFYGWSFFCAVLLSPTLLSRKTALWTNDLWSSGLVWICDHILGLHYEVKGRENLPEGPFIVASKHQSAWDTFIYHKILDQACYVLKKELMWIPFFGWFLARLGMIPVSRSKTKALQDMRIMLEAADRSLENHQTIVIFPEGTRSQPGVAGVYHSGITILYNHLKLPIVPVALNSGLFWPRKGFVKKPGIITLEYLKPIPPGLPRQQLVPLLESEIETASLRLYNEGLVHAQNI